MDQSELKIRSTFYCCICYRTTDSAASTPVLQPSVQGTANTPVRPPTSTAQGMSRKCKRQERNIDEVDEAILSRIDRLQQEDGEEAFGKHVAACLRQMNPRQRAITRIEIEKLLLNMQFPDDPYSPYTSNYYNM